MKLYWLVALGGAAGSVARFGLSTVVQTRWNGALPVGTMLVNVTGSLLLGFLLRYALDTPVVSPEMRALLATGFCGGYTTFSTFSYETMALVEDGDWRRAALYVLLSLAASLVGVCLGTTLAREALALRRMV